MRARPAPSHPGRLRPGPSPNKTRARRSAELALAVCALGLVPGPAASQASVYRCGTSYQQQPCSGGQLVDVADPRDAEQQRSAHEVLAADQRLARQLGAERRERERDLRPQNQAVGISRPTEPARPNALPDCKRPAGHTRPSTSRKQSPCTDLPAYAAPGLQGKPGARSN